MAAAIEGILETALYADDLDAAEAFYGGILGLEKITRQADRHVFFRCGPGVLLIFNPKETVHPPPPTPSPCRCTGRRGRDTAVSGFRGQSLISG